MGTQGIKAGSAFVEATLNDKKLRRGLARVKRQLKAFGSSLLAVGRSIAVMGGAIIAFGAIALRTFLKVGDEIDKSARRAQISAKAYQELRLAAEEAGGSGTDIVKGIQSLSKAVNEAGRGVATYADSLESIGLTYDDLKDKTPDKQFRAVVQALSDTEDPTKRAAAAQILLGRAGKTLVPLLEEGAAGLDRIAKRAQDAGIILGDDLVEKAAKLVDEFGLLKRQFIALATIIGAQLGDGFGDLIKLFGGLLKNAIDFVKENKGMVVSIFKLGAALTALGLTIAALGISFILLGSAVGALMTIMGALATAIGAVTTAAGVMWAVISSPAVAVVAVFGLVLANVLAAQGAFDSMAEAGANAFQTVKGDAMEAADVIRQAFMAGDLVGAFKVALALLKLEWVRFSEFFKSGAAGLWIDVQTLWTDGVNSILMIWIKVISKIKGAFIDLKGFMKSGIAAITGDVSGVAAADDQQRLEQRKRKQDDNLKLSIARTINDTKLGELGKERESVEEKSAAKVAEALKAFNDQLSEVRKSAQAAKKKTEDGTDGAGAGAAAAGMTIASGFSAASINRNLGLSKDPAKENQKKQKELIEWNKLTALGIKKLTKTINQTRAGATFS